jgi:hypothetical protein
MKKEAQEQHHRGEQGGPRAEQMEGAGGQPRQGDRRTETSRTPPEDESFGEGSAPSEQGRGAPRAQTIARHQQGIGRQSGSHSAHGDDVQEQSVRGEPQGEHARDGRQHVPGDRSRD